MTPEVFTLEIAGRRVACFDADSIDDAREHVAGIHGDLQAFTSGGHPMWDGTSPLIVSLATPGEAARWTTSYEMAKRINGDFADPDTFPLCTVFLIQCATERGIELSAGPAIAQ